MLNYRLRVDHDLALWQQHGWVTPEGAIAIRADLAKQRSRLDLAGSLAILGAVLIGFAIISFVAANWPALSKLSKLSLIAVTLLACYGVAVELFRRNLDALAHASVLAGITAYGGGIMLIAQMYHLDGHAPDAVWAWGIGALIAGLAIPSNPALTAAMGLFALWNVYELSAGPAHHVHWAFLPVWGVTALGFAYTRWQPGVHVASLALTSWILMLGAVLPGTGYAIITLIGLALCGASLAFGTTIDRVRRVSGAMFDYGLVIAFAGAFALQFIEFQTTIGLLLFGALTLAGLLAAIAWAWRTDNKPALWIAYTAFSVEIFSLYIKKLGSLMGTSAFFLCAGLIVIALAAIAIRLHRTAVVTPSGGPTS
jgi:uncharacterized membrane protein